MFVVDVPVISLMPPRGAPYLWLVRILTDLAKDEYVLQTLGLWLIAIAFLLPLFGGIRRVMLAALGLQIQFIFFAVLLPNLVANVIKGFAGRGRPFASGVANAFYYSPFAWTEKFASLPSGHATTGFALAFAVAAVWPRTRYVMAAYALLIALSRVVLLAHHPSDVVAGALTGIVGAMFVRQWFAARRLGFVIHGDGGISPVPRLSISRFKGVAGRAFAP